MFNKQRTGCQCAKFSVNFSSMLHERDGSDSICFVIILRGARGNEPATVTVGKVCITFTLNRYLFCSMAVRVVRIRFVTYYLALYSKYNSFFLLSKHQTQKDHTIYRTSPLTLDMGSFSVLKVQYSTRLDCQRKKHNFFYLI